MNKIEKIEKIVDMKRVVAVLDFNTVKSFDVDTKIGRLMVTDDEIVMYYHEIRYNIPIDKDHHWHYRIAIYSNGDLGIHRGLSIAGFIKKHPMIKVKLF